MKSFILASFMLFSNATFAQKLDPEFLITSVEVHQVENLDSQERVELPKVPTNPVDEIAMYLDGLIAIGKKIWPIIEAGRPVINTNGLGNAISVLPQIEGEVSRSPLHQMANWSAPKAVSFRVSYKNAYGGEVVGFTYTMYFQHDGTYKGKGKYITSLKVQASEVYARWGFNFDAVSELVSVANVGSEENPVASAIIQISYKTRGLLNEMRNAHSIYVDGTGVAKTLQ